MQRPLEELAQAGLLHELAGVHHADAVADLGDHAEVVGDVEDRRVELPLEVGDQVEDDGLGGDVEGRRRLVHDEQRRVGHQRHGDDAALQHAAGELVRVALHHRLGVGHGDLGEHLDDASLGGARVHAEVLAGHLGELLADDDGRVQRAQRALVDHADARSPQLAELLGRQPEQLDAVQAHAAVGDLAVGGQVADGAHGERRLARAGLADEAEALVLVHGERDVAHRVQHAELGRVVDVQALDLEDGAGRLGGFAGRRRPLHDRRHLSSSRRRAA